MSTEVESNKTENAASPPDITSGPADRIWTEYFQSNRPDLNVVRMLVLDLHEKKEHEHVIHCIQAALLNGQAQPWMYEVLALSMEIAGRPKADVQRVLLSLTDFGNADFTTMMYSAAYLTRFDRNETALRLYRQASRLAPERPEPYILGLKLAQKLNADDDTLWAAAGILEHGWTKNYQQLHRDAENAIVELARKRQAEGNDSGVAQLTQTVAAAKRRDLMVTLTWNGPADLDLIVEEPGGTVCSFDSPDSPGGGVHLFDGYGPKSENCREEYVCPQGISGEYRIRVRHSWGDVVGKRAQLTIVTHAGSTQEKRSQQVVVIGENDAVVPVTLEDGRRTRPREVITSRIDPVSALAPPKPLQHGPIVQAAHETDVIQRFRASRENSAIQAGGIPADQAGPVGALGAVGYQPVISNVPEGSFLTVNPVISADRRYVRIAVNPVFTTLTDVFTFSFINGQ